MGGNAQALPDDEVPLDQQMLEDLDDGEIPLANIKKEQPTIVGNLPIYLGIGAAAAFTLIGAIIYLKKKHKAITVKNQNGNGRPTGSGK